MLLRSSVLQPVLRPGDGQVTGPERFRPSPGSRPECHQLGDSGAASAEPPLLAAAFSFEPTDTLQALVAGT